MPKINNYRDYMVKVNLVFPDDRLLHSMEKSKLIIKYDHYATRADGMEIFKVCIERNNYEKFRKVLAVYEKMKGLKDVKERILPLTVTKKYK